MELTEEKATIYLSIGKLEIPLTGVRVIQKNFISGPGSGEDQSFEIWTDGMLYLRFTKKEEK